MILLVMDRAELDEVVKVLPYSVYSPEDPDAFEYPVYVKLVLTDMRNRDLQQDEETIVIITMSQHELADADERRRVQIEKQLLGYNYAESRETDEATSGAVEEQASFIPELFGEDRIRRT